MFLNFAQGMEKISKQNQPILEDLELYLRAIGYQISSKKSILRGAKEFIVWLEDEGINDLNQVQKKHIKKYQNYLETRPNRVFEGALSSKMVRDYLWTISVLFRLMEQQGKLFQNPLSGYLLPKVTNEKRAILSLAEIKQLYQVCSNPKERCILHIYYGLGLRRSEGEALNLQDVDYKNGWLYVQKGKGGQGRNIPLTNSIQEDLKNYVLYQRQTAANQAFLLNQNGDRMQGSSALLILKKLLKKAQIIKPIDLHCLRHSIATHLINQGMKIEQVQAYLGHRHLESTQRYIHYDTKKLFKDQSHSSHSQEL